MMSHHNYCKWSRIDDKNIVAVEAGLMIKS